MRRRSLMSAGIAAAAAGIAQPRVARALQHAPDAPHAHDASSGLAGTAGGRAAARSTGRRIGIALGSGSAHGLAHIGVLKLLVREGLHLEVLAGTSAGAIVGVLHAAGLDLDAIEAVARSLDWRSSGRLVWPTSGLMSNLPIQRRIDEALGRRRIEALPIPFGAVATNVLDGSRVLLRSGAAGQVVGASSSIPVLFEPVRIDGLELVDGSLTEPVPVDSARAMGADFVIGVDIAYRPHDERPRGVTDMAFQMMHIMINALIAEQVRRADFTLRVELHHLMQGNWAPQTLIDEGERAASAAWPELAERLRAAGFSLPGR